MRTSNIQTNYEFHKEMRQRWIDRSKLKIEEWSILLMPFGAGLLFVTTLA